MSKVHSYLSKADHERLLKVCDAEGCKPYMMVKMAVLDKIYNYPLKEGGAEQSPAVILGETETPRSPEKTSDEKARDVAETVKEIIKRKTP